ITVGLAETIQSLIGGSDSIATGPGNDVVFGGIDGDTINAGDGNNVVLGDSGYVDWTAHDAGRVYDTLTNAAGTLSGDDTNASDIDRVFSTNPDHGGNDNITTGSGDDIIIGGEDGELVVDAIIPAGVGVTGAVDTARRVDAAGVGN